MIEVTLDVPVYVFAVVEPEQGLSTIPEWTSMTAFVVKYIPDCMLHAQIFSTRL